MTVHVTIAVDEAVKADLDEWALARGMPVGDMLAEVLADYVQEHRDLVEGVARGRAALAAGDVLDHEDAVAEFAKIRAEWLNPA